MAVSENPKQAAKTGGAAALPERLRKLWSDGPGGGAGRRAFGPAAFRIAPAPVTVMDLREALGFLGTLPPLPGARRLRHDILSNATLQGLAEPLEFYLRLLGVDPDLRFHSPYGLPADIGESEAVLAVLDFEKFAGRDSAPDAGMVGAWLENLRREAPGASVLVGEPLPPLGSPAVPSDRDGRRREEFRTGLSEALGRIGATMVSWCAPLARLGWERARRAPEYFHYDQLLTQDGLCVAAEAAARHLAALVTPRRKVLCLDADNTLWDGVVGEDGPDGIAYRPDTARGRCFQAVHRQIARLSSEGVLLALASRNDERSVLEILDRPEFPLKRADFAAWRINWGPKSVAIREMALELNLGPDAFVFLDDSPAERAEVGAALPEVDIVAVPEKVDLYPSVLGRVAGFDRLVVTREDEGRKDEYARQAQRRQAQAQDPAAFLEKLRIRLDVRRAGASDLARVGQLIAKTNQFRLGPWSPTEAELKLRSEDRDWLVLRVAYADAFGDSGVVGAAVLQRAGAGWAVRQAVLSCRVLGRGVEDRILGDWAGRFAPLAVDFEVTGRNTVAEQTLQRRGWPGPLRAAEAAESEKINLSFQEL
jgi:FkbH-like protein